MALEDNDLNFIIYNILWSEIPGDFRILRIDQHVPLSGVSTVATYIPKFIQLYLPAMIDWQKNNIANKPVALADELTLSP